MKKKEKVKIILNFLEQNYNDSKCSLNFGSTYELLIATRLSAQCTDKKVNLVTEKLFLKYKSLNSFATASFSDVKEIIKPCGLSNKKAQDIINICKILIEKFNSKVPNKMEDLLTLPGVGRKTANVILGNVFNKPAIVVDTHVKRISNRLGLVNSQDATKIENILFNLIPKNESVNFCHRVIAFGREICSAKKPLCNICKLNSICSKYKKH